MTVIEEQKGDPASPPWGRMGKGGSFGKPGGGWADPVGLKGTRKGGGESRGGSCRYVDGSLASLGLVGEPGVLQRTGAGGSSRVNCLFWGSLECTLLSQGKPF